MSTIVYEPNLIILWKKCKLHPY